MMKEQSSTTMYGVVYDVPYESSVLLGLYFLQGEAEAALEHYIAEQSEIGEEEDWYRENSRVVPLVVGQPANFNFVP